MQSISKQLAIVTILGMTAVGLSACNTMEGVGEDVEAAGNAVENAAEENNTYSK